MSEERKLIEDAADLLAEIQPQVWQEHLNEEVGKWFIRYQRVVSKEVHEPGYKGVF